MAYVPVVFISSTSEDLKDHRDQAAKAAEVMGFRLIRMESFTDGGDARSLPACLEKVRQADVVVVLVAHHYGWLPEYDNPDAKSITYDPDVYLKTLEDDTRQIRIKGLKTKRAEPYVFGIDEIYMSHEPPKRYGWNPWNSARSFLVIQPGSDHSNLKEDG